MSDWLDPVRATLAARATPVTVFVRDDDGGWDNDALFALLETTQCLGVPVDVAVIPDACDAVLASALGATDRALVRLHQHGRAHANHETNGRKCEFGPSRSPHEQHRDLIEGRARLRDLLGDRVDPIFTPPWNRCTAATSRYLVDLEYELLSRDLTAGRFADDRLHELPVSLDWTGRRGVKGGRDAWGRTIADGIRDARAPLGLMLHHAVMTSDDRRLLSQLLEVLVPHDTVRCQSMLALAQKGAKEGDL
jgi:hypothetical protein